MTKRPLSYRIRRRFQRHLAEPFEERFVLPARRRRNAGRTYRPIFVTGTMGSGTTLMALSLAQRFHCAGVVTESGHQISRDSPLHVAHPHDFATVADYLESLQPRPDWRVNEAREDLLMLYRGHANGPADAMIDKGPNISLLRAEFLRRCFLDSWFVLVFRDPVANVEGFRRKWEPFSSEPLESSADFYEATHLAFLEQTADFRESVIGVSYETLVENHDEVLSSIATRIGLEPTEATRRLEPRPNVPGQGVRNVQGNRIGLIQDANRRAYDALDDTEMEMIESRLRPLYRKLEDETAIL